MPHKPVRCPCSPSAATWYHSHKGSLVRLSGRWQRHMSLHQHACSRCHAISWSYGWCCGIERFEDTAKVLANGLLNYHSMLWFACQAPPHRICPIWQCSALACHMPHAKLRRGTKWLCGPKSLRSMIRKQRTLEKCSKLLSCSWSSARKTFQNQYVHYRCPWILRLSRQYPSADGRGLQPLGPEES